MDKKFEEHLQYYKETKILTIELVLDATIVMFLTPFSPEWNEVFDDINEIKQEIKKFDEICWPYIKKKNIEEKSYSLFRFTHKELQLLSMETLGRIMNTITIDKKMVTIINNSHPNNKSTCGIQGINATKEEAIELIQTVVSNWDPNKFNVYENENITLL